MPIDVPRVPQPVGSRYCCGSVMRRTGTPRFFAAIIASVCRSSVMRYMITSIFCVSSVVLADRAVGVRLVRRKVELRILGVASGSRGSRGRRDVRVVRIPGRGRPQVVELGHEAVDERRALSVKYTDSST